MLGELTVEDLFDLTHKDFKQKTSMIVSELYPGGLDEYKKAIYKFIH